MNRVTRIGAGRGSQARHGGAASRIARTRSSSGRAQQEKAGEPRRLVEIGALASKLATELGDGVSACVFRAQVLKRRAVRGDIDASEVAELSQKIIDGLQPLVDRLDAWVEFAHTRTFALETVALEGFFARLIADWRGPANDRGIALRIASDSVLPRVTMDRAKMRLVFDHLVGNALDACKPSGGRVTIRVRAPSPKHVRITVEDNGDGVAAGTELFAVFTTTKRDGGGLGLAIAKEIVNAHGGEIDYIAGLLGGSAFAIELPVKPPLDGN